MSPASTPPGCSARSAPCADSIETGVCVCVCGGAVCWLARLHHLITLLPRAPCVLRQCYLGKWFSIQHNVDKRDSFGGGNGMIFSLLLHQSVANHQYVEATYIPAVLSIDFPYYSSANFTHIVHKRWVGKNVVKKPTTTKRLPPAHNEMPVHGLAFYRT